MSDHLGQDTSIGKYARSVESGWLGRIEGEEDGMLRMIGVNELCLGIEGGTPDQWLDKDDVQWFAPEDVVVQTLEAS